MPTLFTRILAGELPARFVWTDDVSAAFLSIAPLRPGHTLLVPRLEVDHWLDAPEDLLSHLTTVAKRLGEAIQRAFDAPRVGLVIAGLEVPHLHLHVFPAWRLADFDFGRVDPHPSPESLDDAAGRIRAALRAGGHGGHLPAD